MTVSARSSLPRWLFHTTRAISRKAVAAMRTLPKKTRVKINQPNANAAANTAPQCIFPARNAAVKAQAKPAMQQTDNASVIK